MIMKKISILILAAAMVLPAACVKEAFREAEPVSLTVSISSEDSSPLSVKTHLGEVSGNKRKVYWSNGDAICVNGVASNALAEVGETASSATFTFASGLGLAPYKILYPASIWADDTHVTLPATQTYKSGTFADGTFPMAGYSADGSNISVSHLCAVLKVNILRKIGEGADEHDLVSATFRGLGDEQVSGSFTIDYQNATLTSTSSDAADKQVKVSRALTTSTSTPVSYYIVVPARTYASGIAIDIQDKGSDMMTLSKATSVTLEAGKLYDMQTVPFERTGDAPADITITTAQELIDFAHAYNEGTISGDDIIVALGNDITFDDDLSDDFNTEGGIGKTGAAALFNGMFNGAGHSINGLKATVPLFARVGKNGTVKNLTMGSTSSVNYSADVTEELFLGAIAGDCKGTILNCVNNAPVSCTSASYSNAVNIGGIVGRQREASKVEYCENHGTITFTSLTGTSAVNMGGITGILDIHNEGDKAVINHCTNYGTVDRGVVSNTNTASQSPTHVGGVVGWIYSVYGQTANISLTDLHHTTGNVYGPDMANTAQVGGIPVVVGGIVGGIHGDDLSSGTADVAITNSSVSNCTVRNNHWNNSTSYGSGAHAGGFVGISRGKSKNVTYSGCEVNNVNVGNLRGYGGGFVGYARETLIDNSDVLASSVVATAQLFYGGGLAGVAYNTDITSCDVTLTKNNTYSLRTRGSQYYSGGIAGWMQGSSTISGCRAYVKLMYQDGGTGNTGVRGWIAGKCEGTPTIKNCGLGGTYGKTTADITLSNSNFSDYIYGSSSVASTVCSGCYYWGGTIGTFPARLAIIGDSISTFEGIIPSGHKAYYTNPPASGCDVTDWTKTYWGHLINDYWHSTLDVNTSWSGSSVASGKEGAVRTPFVDDSRLSLLNDPDCVILFGGTNDAIDSNGIGLGEFSYDTPLASINHNKRFRDAYIYVIKYIQENFPSAMIICIIGTDITGDYGTSVEAIASHYSLPCIDFRGEKNVAGKVTIFSGSHPDAAGHAYMAQKIYNETLSLF